MAQAKSSTQKSLQDILKEAKKVETDSIEGLSYLEEGIPEKQVEIEVPQKEPEKPKKTEKAPVKKAETKKKAEKKEKIETVVESEVVKAPSRLIAPKKELKSVKVGFIITEKAKKNLMKYTEMYEFRSSNDFINELLENLDAYLGGEE